MHIHTHAHSSAFSRAFAIMKTSRLMIIAYACAYLYEYLRRWIVPLFVVGNRKETKDSHTMQKQKQIQKVKKK